MFPSFIFLHRSHFVVRGALFFLEIFHFSRSLHGPEQQVLIFFPCFMLFSGFCAVHMLPRHFDLTSNCRDRFPFCFRHRKKYRKIDRPKGQQQFFFSILARLSASDGHKSCRPATPFLLPKTLLSIRKERNRFAEPVTLKKSLCTIVVSFFSFLLN